MRRVSTLTILVSLLASGMAAAASARQPDTDISVRQYTPTSVFHGSKSASGQLAESDANLVKRNDSQLVNVLVKLDADAVASYTGDVHGLAATSPGVTGRSLAANASAVNAYRGYLNRLALGVRRSAQRHVPGISLGRTYATAYGGFAARIPANRAKDLLSIPGVSAVQYDTVNHLTANDSPIFIGADLVWPKLGGEGKAGEGVKVGILDTGVWPEHPMLQDSANLAHPGGTYDCEFGLSGEAHDAATTCNDKLIGAYAFLNTNLSVTGTDPGEYCTGASACSARDADGHGTHTATTAAGSPVDESVLLGVDRGHISGIAPGAHVIGYRVCDQDGCFSSDSVAAIEQAIQDDVDVINFSIGGGNSAYTDPVELAFLDAYAAGILVNASAGNDGPGSGTANHAGPWTNTVGASTLNRQFKSQLRLTANGGDTLNINGATVTRGITSPTPVVLSPSALCPNEAAPGTYTGKIVVCERGDNPRVAKGYNVLQGGAVGMILYNDGPTDLETDNHYLPTIHLNDPNERIRAFVNTHNNVRATWVQGTAAAATGDVMASFSSRGPLGDFIKPDVTAPGVQILAGNSAQHLDTPEEGLGPNGELYQAIAGTSMSSPHAAGVAALLKDAHPTWTPGQLKSAMMTSSMQSVVKENGTTPATPFDRGAGSIRANRADRPVVTFDVTAAQYFASAANPLARIGLNLPSINAPQMDGIVTTTRTARNVSGSTQTLRLSYAGSGAVTLTPRTLTIANGATATFTIKIDATYLADGQYFGKITLNPDASGQLNAILPVAFNKAPGDVAIDNSCGVPSASAVDQSITIETGDVLDCEMTVTNLGTTAATVSTRVRAPNTDRLIIRNWSSGTKSGNGFARSVTLNPPAPAEIESIDSPGFGYISLPGLGVPPEPDFADEDLFVYDGVTPFTYAGTVYDTIGIDANGYVVVGHDITAEDNNCCDPQMPDSTRPNNVIAPYWTDLNPELGGEIYFGEVSFDDFVTSYLVVEWHEVPVFTTASEPRTFQVWLAGTTLPEEVSFEYCITPNSSPVGPTNDGCDDPAAPALFGAGDADGLLVGAENRDGSSAATIGPSGTQPMSNGYEVIAGNPGSADSLTVSYEAFGKRTGQKLDITASMTSNVTPGTATSVVRVRVISP